MATQPDETRLLAAAREGDRAAREALIRGYEATVAKTVIGMLGPGPDAEDAGQEAMIRFPKAVMAVTPGKRRAQSGRPLIPAENWELIGPPTLLLAVANEDDRFVGDTDAKAIYRRTRLIPTKDKDLVVLKSDRHGDPDLVASHNAPTTGGTLPGVEAPPVGCAAGRAPGPPGGRGWRAQAGLAEVDAKRTLDALDWYGTWKLFDGLTDAAFYGRNREYALGGSKEQRFMGHWSDGTPVRELDVLRPE